MDHPRRLNPRFAAAALALVLAIICAPGRAQDAYAVEVVIFRHWEAPGEDAEFWPDRPPPISRLATRRLVTLRSAKANGSDALAFSRLPDTKLQLAGIRQRLADSQDYEVLLHIGWRQPALKGDSAAAVTLPLNWSPPPLSAVDAASSGIPSSPNPFDYLPPGTRLWGTLRLVQKRYLHFQADLRYRRNDAARADEKATVYSMTQTRRMRAGEIHYLDHPVLGLMVQARRLRPEHDLSRN